MDAKSLLECTSILQDALLIGVSPKVEPPPTPVEEEEEEVKPEEPTLLGAELNVRLLDLDPESATPSSSNEAARKLFEDVRGSATTITIDDAADALASSTLLDEALHGPKLWGGDESVSLELLRRLLRREGSTISLSAFLRTHQRLIGGAFPCEGRGPRLVVERRNKRERPGGVYEFLGTGPGLYDGRTHITARGFAGRARSSWLLREKRTSGALRHDPS